MKQYQSVSGIKVYASSPDDADAAFCKEAQKAGIYLYEARRFCPNKIEFQTCEKYFFREDDSKILAKNDEVLVIEDSFDYGVITPTAFMIWYKPINSEQGQEMPSKKLAGKSFYLDPGHGGKDSGAVNDNLGLQEKIAAFDVCLFLGAYLAEHGAKFYLSRSGDSYPSLTARANEANSLDVTAFISIHLNCAENKSASGIETLVYSLKGTAAKLAEKVQKNMVAATGWKDRGVKERPGLTVLKKTKMPAILCEIGFISNDEQAVSLFMPQMQDNIARAIADGVIEQFGK